MSELQIIGMIISAILFLLGGYYVYKHYEVLWLIKETPTSEVRSLNSEELVELKGKVNSTQTLDTSISGGDDVVVSGWKVDDWDERGDHSHWKTVAIGIDSGRFELEDDGDSVTVDPPSATSGFVTSDDKFLSWGGDGVYVDNCRAEFGEFNLQKKIKPDESEPLRIKKFIRRQPDVGQQSGSITNLIDIGKKHGERRYFEGTIREGDEIYLLGYAQKKDGSTHAPGSDELVIGPDPSGDKPFVISNVGEELLVSGVRIRVILASLVSIIGLVILLLSVV